MNVRVVTPPSVEPVTADEVKTFARIDNTGDTAADTANDALLAALIASAREEAEQLTGRAILTQTLELTLDRFPRCGRGIELPRPPLVSVTTLTYYDVEDTETIMDTAAYRILDAAEAIPASVYPAAAGFWPDTYSCRTEAAFFGAYRRPDAVRIRYTAGWPNAAAVPENIKTWIKLRVSTLWANRETFLADNRAAAIDLPGRFFDGLLDRWRVTGVA